MSFLARSHPGVLQLWCHQRAEETTAKTDLILKGQQLQLGPTSQLRT